LEIIKRIGFFGDTHCGNQWGLTPPNWQGKGPLVKGIALEFWDWYKSTTMDLPLLDLAVGVGDLIDGPGHKGTMEHITTDLGEQREMAKICLDLVPTKEWVFVRGTGYHVTTATEEEDGLAKDMGGKIFNELNINVEGKRINVFHKGRRTSSPGGQPSQTYKEMVRKQIMADIQGKDAPDLVVRAHIHTYVEVHQRSKIAMSNPALELPFGAYGRGLFTHYYDLGFTVANITASGKIIIVPYFLPIEMQDNEGEIYV